jgi:hypothetical protein
VLTAPSRQVKAVTVESVGQPDAGDSSYIMYRTICQTWRTSALYARDGFSVDTALLTAGMRRLPSTTGGGGGGGGAALPSTTEGGGGLPRAGSTSAAALSTLSLSLSESHSYALLRVNRSSENAPLISQPQRVSYVRRSADRAFGDRSDHSNSLCRLAGNLGQTHLKVLFRRDSGRLFVGLCLRVRAGEIVDRQPHVVPVRDERHLADVTQFAAERVLGSTARNRGRGDPNEIVEGEKFVAVEVDDSAKAGTFGFVKCYVETVPLARLRGAPFVLTRDDEYGCSSESCHVGRQVNKDTLRLRGRPEGLRSS